MKFVKLIQASARHDDDKTSETYVQDALTQLNICLSEDPNCFKKASPWKPILIISTSNASFNRELSPHRMTSLYEESQDFLTQLGLNPRTIQCSHITRIVDKAVEIKPYNLTDRLKEWAKDAKVLPSDTQKLKKIFTDELVAAEQIIIQRYKRHNEVMESHDRDISTSPKKTKKRREGTNSIVSRNKFSSSQSGKDRLYVLQQCWLEV
jgi:hypothetical protein